MVKGWLKHGNISVRTRSAQSGRGTDFQRVYGGSRLLRTVSLIHTD